MDQLVQLIRRLTEHQVQFVLIGGMAASAHGSPVISLDVDVVAPLDDQNMQKILDAVKDLRPHWRFRPDKFIPVDTVERFRGCRNLYINTDWGLLHVLGELPKVCGWEDVFKHSTEMDLGGFVCRVLDIDLLITAKRTAGRPKDITNVHHLEALQKMRREQPGLFE